MHPSRRGLAAVLGAALVGAVPTVPAAAATEVAAPVTPLWRATYDDAGDVDTAVDVAVDPVTGRTFVTGTVLNASRNSDVVTVAYAQDGTELWTARVVGDVGGFDFPEQIAVDPARGQVYVAGTLDQGPRGRGFVVAYDLDGQRRWSRIDGPDRRNLGWRQVAADPDTAQVFLAGDSVASSSFTDGRVLVRALTADGALRWTRQLFTGPGVDSVDALALNQAYPQRPGAPAVVITGGRDTDDGSVGYVQAFTGTGATAWAAEFDRPAESLDRGVAIGVAADGTAVYVAAPNELDVDVRAYDGHDGDPLWVTTVASEAFGRLTPVALAVDGLGGRVAVTGFSFTGGSSVITTAALDASGATLWRTTTAGDTELGPTDALIDDARERLYVSGYRNRQPGAFRRNGLVFAFDLDTGAQRLVYGDGVGSDSFFAAIARDGERDRLVVTGNTQPAVGSLADYLTVALPPG